MASLRGLRDVVGSDGADDERIGRVQHLEHDDDEPACTGGAEGDGTAGRVAQVERRIFVEECGLDLFRC
jgi:hypothetical protein